MYNFIHASSFPLRLAVEGTHVTEKDAISSDYILDCVKRNTLLKMRDYRWDESFIKAVFIYVLFKSTTYIALTHSRWIVCR